MGALLECPDRRERGRVERYEPFFLELAERDLEEAVAGVVLTHTVALEVAQLADAQARSTHHIQSEGDVRVGPLEARLQLQVRLWRQRPWQVVRLLRKVADDDELLPG